MKNILIIGAGSIANRHAGVIERIDEINVAGVCDLQAERAKALAGKLSSTAYTDIDEAIEKSAPDYVVLLTPRVFREPVFERCARLGLPIFSEKPPCADMETGRRIVDLLDKSNLLHTVGFMHRWHDALNTVLEQTKDEKLSVINVSYQSPFAAQPVIDDYPDPYLVAKTGGIVGDQGIHYVDVSRYIAKSEVKNITASGVNQLLPVSQRVTTRDVACWVLQMTNGVVVCHSHTWAAPAWGCKIELITDKSIVTVDMFGNTARGTIAGEDFEYKGTLDEFEAEHRGFLRAVNENDPSVVRSPFADALESFKVTEEINSILYGRIS